MRNGGVEMGALCDLPNVGKVLEKNLMEVGIMSPVELRETGARETFLRIRSSVDPGACLHMLYGLEGAVRGVKDTLLDQDTKRSLKAFYSSL